MKANELRIGNYVFKDGCEYIADHITILMAHNYKPIPLTEEWLLEFMFVKHPVKKEYLHTKFGGSILMTYNGKNYLFKSMHGDPLTAIEFVHQLQNLYFALTGEELTLNKKGE